MRMSMTSLSLKLMAIGLLCLSLTSCDEDNTDNPVAPAPVVTSSPSPSPVATPTPTPSPEPCANENVLVNAKRNGDIVYAWTPGQIATLHADPMDIFGQMLPDNCPGVQVVGWALSGIAVCRGQGPQGIRTLRDVCDTVGSHHVDATINQRKGSADFSIIDAALARRLEEAGVDWQHLRPLALNHAIQLFGGDPQ